jgi:hypothetical protein
MKKFPVIQMEDKKLFQKVKKLLKTKHVVDPMEDVYRSIAIVEMILHDSIDLKIETNVVTWAIKFMKQDPSLDISDAMIMAYDEWTK